MGGSANFYHTDANRRRTYWHKDDPNGPLYDLYKARGGGAMDKASKANSKFSVMRDEASKMTNKQAYNWAQYAIDNGYTDAADAYMKNDGKYSGPDYAKQDKLSERAAGDYGDKQDILDGIQNAALNSER